MSASTERIAVLLAASCLLGGAARPAFAHDVPTAFRVLFAPGAPDRLVVALRPGLALSDDRGAHWTFLCGAVTGIAGGDRYPVALSRDGHALVGAFDALHRDDGGGCSWSVLPTAAPPGRVGALTRNAAGELEALAANPGRDNGLLVSVDDGFSFAPLGSPITAAARLESFARAASDPARVYAAGSSAAGSAAIWRSDDAGHSWRELRPAGVGRVELLAIDPRDADRLWVARATPEEPFLPDRVEESRDGGASFESRLELEELGGFAISDDGSQLFAGDRAGGLYRAADGHAFERVQASLHVGCLLLRGDELWLCARDEVALDPFAVGVSRDQGQSFVAVLRSDQLRRLHTCGSPRQAALCNAEWAQWKNDIFGSLDDPPLPADDASGMNPSLPFAPSAAAADASATDPSRDGAEARPPDEREPAGAEPAAGSCSPTRATISHRTTRAMTAWLCVLLALRARMWRACRRSQPGRHSD